MRKTKTDTEQSHFNCRCRERGITTTDLDALHLALKTACAKYDTSQIAREYVDHVMDIADGRKIYRFHVEEGTYYVVADCAGHPLTVLTQEMLAYYKATKKSKKAKRPPKLTTWQMRIKMGMSKGEAKTNDSRRIAKGRGIKNR